ncbi:hypothetical protein R5R35_011582 [Gryllus longicercus]|uniref:Thioredoxin domain-containing protein 17 n=1 Tax=Gryllus longicercus TaxID=2509291 RepID=A0AAN9VRN3_9ORTH
MDLKAVTHVDGYEEFVKTVAELEKNNKPIFILFSGSLDESGENWCSDCREAEPVIQEALASLPENAQFLHVGVGPRDEWRDQNNPFRKQSNLKLKCVPTLMRWKAPERLEEAECKKIDLVKMLFEEED